MTWPAVNTIGFLGERLDWHARRMATFGPMRFVMENPDNTPVDLTGCEVFGWIKKTIDDETNLLTLEGVITSPTAGEYEIGVTAEDLAILKGGRDVIDSESRYPWRLFLRDHLTRVTPLYHGFVICVK